MKIYRFCFWGRQIKKEVIEVREHPKSYADKNSDYKRLFRKEEVGKVSDFGCSVVLLEDDLKKAAAIFLSYWENDRRQREKQLQASEEKIEFFKGVINEQSDLNGSAVQ